MAREIEHKYLVKDDSYKAISLSHSLIRQGYLSRVPERVVRVRTYGDKGFLTVKGKNDGDTRLEFEYPVPYEDAVEMLGLCEGAIVEKVRWIVEYKGYRWEVDEFQSPRQLTVAEIELTSSDCCYPLPPFIGENVTGNPEYYNSNLSR